MAPKHTIIGTPPSTFTRTVTLALHYKSLPFTQVPVFPHSSTADAVHPFGYIPTLIIHGDEGDGDGDGDMPLRETQAIIRYIDRIAPGLTLHLRPGEGERDMIEEKMWEYVSFVASYGFQAIEHGLVKPRLAHLASGLSSSATTTLLASSPGIAEVNRFFSITESLLPPLSPSTNSTPLFLFTSHPTYADFYLFPILADLRATPEWTSVVLKHGVGERLERWMEQMERLQCVKATREGTLSDGADGRG